MIYVEREITGGGKRRGLVCRVDLEEYDYHPGSQALIRATEKTVLERIPPRVHIREHAPLELPHVMILMDDSARSVIAPLEAHKDEMGDYDPEEILFIVQGEMEYTESLDEE